MSKGRFAGIYPMLYTFFDEAGGLDRAAMRAQIEFCIAAGVSGIAILGIVGEFNKMDVAERRAVLLRAVGQDAQRDIDRLVAHKTFVADLHPDRVEKHQRIAGVQRPTLPLRHRLQHRVGDRRNQVRRDVDAVELLKMPANLAHRHATRVSVVECFETVAVGCERRIRHIWVERYAAWWRWSKRR